MDSSTVNTILIGIFGLLSLYVNYRISLRMAEIKATQTVVQASQVEAKVERAEQKEQIKEVHTAVNSERTTMIAKLDAMHEKISLLETAAGVRASEDAAIVSERASATRGARATDEPSKVEVVNTNAIPVVPTKPLS